ncbi:DNA-directed RNA polymerase subunit G [Pyrodictium occultum]|uniref:DNA-directed RNA polymerase subunit G n=1 Tax=Pyrodictium occultum TaxID=2309 RepID=UPI0022A90D13|nr:DNA-directed RNA polymerase subunit G [Pyrodictium occultum]
MIAQFRGRVESVERELIPRMFLARIKSLDGVYEVEMDIHRDLVVYEPGTEVEVTVSRELPAYKDGEDLVGRGTVVSMKDEGGRKAVLISLGGLLFILRSSKELDVKPTEKLYVKVSKL